MIDLVAVQKFVNVLAHRAGLRVRYVDRPMFATEPGGTLIIQRPELGWDDAKLRIWRNGVAHEIGHWLPEVRDIFDLLTNKKIETGNVFGACLNIVDDFRNDRNRCEVYPGTRADKVFATDYLMATMWIPGLSKGDRSEANEITDTMIAAYVRMMASVDRSLLQSYAGVYAVLSDKQRAWLDTMEDGAWFTRWDEQETAVQEWQFVCDILREVFNVPEDQVNEMSQGSGNGDDDSGNEEGDGQPGKAGKAVDGEAGSEDGKETVISKQIVTVKYDEIMGQGSHDDEDYTRVRGGMHIDYDNYTESTYDPHTPDTTVIGDPVSAMRHNSRYEEHYRNEIEAAIVDGGVANIAQKARRFLQAETRKLFNPNERHGKVDTRKLTRIVTHDKHSSLPPAIFKTVAQKHAIDTCVSVLVDASGSMNSERKYPLAVAAAWGMIDICATLRIPIEVCAFTEEYDSRNYHLLFKEFDKKITKELFVERGAVTATNMGANADADNIMIAYSRILHRKEPKKLIIVMSDGSPASDRGDCMTYTREVVRNIEKAHQVDIMGVGILDDNVKLIYSNNHVIEAASEIPNALISILKDNVTK